MGYLLVEDCYFSQYSKLRNANSYEDCIKLIKEYDPKIGKKPDYIFYWYLDNGDLGGLFFFDLLCSENCERPLYIYAAHNGKSYGLYYDKPSEWDC